MKKLLCLAVLAICWGCAPENPADAQRLGIRGRILERNGFDANGNDIPGQAANAGFLQRGLINVSSSGNTRLRNVGVPNGFQVISQAPVFQRSNGGYSTFSSGGYSQPVFFQKFSFPSQIIETRQTFEIPLQFEVRQQVEVLQQVPQCVIQCF